MNKKNKVLKIFLSSLILCSPLFNSNNARGVRENNKSDESSTKNSSEFSHNLAKLINTENKSYGKIVLNDTYGDGTLKLLQEMPQSTSKFSLYLNDEKPAFSGKCIKTIEQGQDVYNFTINNYPEGFDFSIDDDRNIAINTIRKAILWRYGNISKDVLNEELISGEASDETPDFKIKEFQIKIKFEKGLNESVATVLDSIVQHNSNSNSRLKDHLNASRKINRVRHLFLDDQKSAQDFRDNCGRVEFINTLLWNNNLSKLEDMPDSYRDCYVYFDNDHVCEGKCKKVLKDGSYIYDFVITSYPYSLENEKREIIREKIQRAIFTHYSSSEVIDDVSRINVRLQLKDQSFKDIIDSLSYGYYRRILKDSKENEINNLAELYLKNLGEKITLLCDKCNNGSDNDIPIISGKFFQGANPSKLVFCTSLEDSELSSSL